MSASPENQAYGSRPHATRHSRWKIGPTILGAAILFAGCSGAESGPAPTATLLPPASDLPTTSVEVATTLAPVVLTDAERDWCRFTGQSDEDALRFDDIFEAGQGIGLRMDAVNALASSLRQTYEEEGMTPDEAVRAVSEELFDNDQFKAACAAAYEIWVEG